MSVAIWQNDVRVSYQMLSLLRQVRLGFLFTLIARNTAGFRLCVVSVSRLCFCLRFHSASAPALSRLSSRSHARLVRLKHYVLYISVHQWPDFENAFWCGADCRKERVGCCLSRSSTRSSSIWQTTRSSTRSSPTYAANLLLCLYSW